MFSNDSGNYSVGMLDVVSRALRGVLGAGLILYVMSSPVTPLGWLAVLPLLAIFPIFTALSGWDPLVAIFQKESITKYFLNYSPAVRAMLFALGGIAIGSAEIIHNFAGYVGYWAVLPLAGIYPIFAAIIGQDPVVALYNIEVMEDRQPAERTLRIIKSGDKAKLDTDFHQAA